MATIKLFADFRKLLGATSLQIDAPTVRAALEQLVARAPELRAAVLADPDTLNEGIILLKDGHNVVFLQGLDTPLEPDTEISLFPPSAGG
jgi:sulfur-carrier protein